MAMMQDDIKKVLAYSSVSQMGYILFGLGSESILGISGGAFMYVSHGLGKGYTLHDGWSNYTPNWHPKHVETWWTCRKNALHCSDCHDWRLDHNGHPPY